MEKWFRLVLFATAAMNIGGALLFAPVSNFARDLFGFPTAHPLYLWILTVWIFAFGACYLWMAITQSRERLFIVIAAVGKLSFAALLIVFWLAGELPFKATLGGAGDLVFGILFVWWLFKNRTSVN